MPRGFFWIGTDTVETSAGTVPAGQMYVEWETPQCASPATPIVLVHGGGGQGLDFLGTPDGRPGWAQLLVSAGHPVYVVDRPGHGRSPFDPAVLGEMAPSMPAEAWLDVMAPERFRQDHDRWPGGWSADDPMVHQMVASSGPMPADWVAMHAREQRRLAELLDLIGPAIVICHSAGGPAGFLAADARPELVTALVAVEPVGPPFLHRSEGASLRWGVAAAPLSFIPPVIDPAELRLRVDDSGPVPVTVQEEPARTLQGLAQVPIALVGSEASTYARINHATAAFLRQAGCRVDLIRLADHGVTGNGHMMMLETNNAEVLRVILRWLHRQTAGPGPDRDRPGDSARGQGDDRDDR